MAAPGVGSEFLVYLPGYVVAVPAAVLAWFQLKDRSRRQEQQRVSEMVLVALYGPDRSKWPTPGNPQAPPVSPLLAAVAKQVEPRNGQTLASTTEEIRDTLATHVSVVEAKLDDQNNTVNDLQAGMAKLAILYTEHVADAHGGQRSW